MKSPLTKSPANIDFIATLRQPLDGILDESLCKQGDAGLILPALWADITMSKRVLDCVESACRDFDDLSTAPQGLAK
jgi:hypothetical protein